MAMVAARLVKQNSAATALFKQASRDCLKDAIAVLKMGWPEAAVTPNAKFLSAVTKGWIPVNNAASLVSTAHRVKFAIIAFAPVVGERPPLNLPKAQAEREQNPMGSGCLFKKDRSFCLLVNHRL